MTIILVTVEAPTVVSISSVWSAIGGEVRAASTSRTHPTTKRDPGI